MGVNSERAMAEVRAALEARHARAGITVVNNVKRRTPVDSGQLRASYTYELTADGVIVGTNKYYASFVEHGTGKYSPGGRMTPWVFPIGGEFRWTEGNPPQPHLLPGTVASIPQLRSIYGGEIR